MTPMNFVLTMSLPEPRGNNDQFELILQDFYNSINSDRTPGRNRKVGVEKNRDVKTRGTPRSTGRKAGGAAFLAVCRGKVRRHFSAFFSCSFLLTVSLFRNRWSPPVLESREIIF